MTAIVACHLVVSTTCRIVRRVSPGFTFASPATLVAASHSVAHLASQLRYEFVELLLNSFLRVLDFDSVSVNTLQPVQHDSLDLF